MGCVASKGDQTITVDPKSGKPKDDAVGAGDVQLDQKPYAAQKTEKRRVGVSAEAYGATGEYKKVVFEKSAEAKQHILVTKDSALFAPLGQAQADVVDAIVVLQARAVDQQGEQENFTSWTAAPTST